MSREELVKLRESIIKSVDGESFTKFDSRGNGMKLTREIFGVKIFFYKFALEKPHHTILLEKVFNFIIKHNVVLIM